MSTPDEQFHEAWLGMVQPEGLVVSLPVLVEADLVARKPPAFHEHVRREHLGIDPKKKPLGPLGLRSVRAFVEDVLEWLPPLRDDAPPEALSLDLQEGHERIQASFALRTPGAAADAPLAERYCLVALELPAEVDLHKNDPREGVWAYPPKHKFERLLRATGVPVGLLTNGRVLRLVYAPLNESSGAIDFQVEDLAKVDGRPILEALVMLLHARRFEGSAEGRSLPELLAQSRKVQAEVSKALEGQVKAALERLLRGFEEAAERDGSGLLEEAHRDDALTTGLLTLLLRIVFVLFAEDRGLLPVDNKLYSDGLSVLELFSRLQHDAASHPDSMSLRFGAYDRLVTLFRAVYLGVRHGDLVMPPRHGELFSPHRFPFLEGWGPAGGAPITLPEERARVRVPSVDDGCVFEVLQKLLYLKRERLSYRALDVEQIGSVYEGLIGYRVERLTSPAVRVGTHEVWVQSAELLAQRPAGRAAYLKELTELSAPKCQELVAAVASAKDEEAVFAGLCGVIQSPEDQALAGRLVVQPGPERKHTSSHYTPRSLSEPIVEKTLRPLLRAMGDSPSSERILSLKVCDPAMGSGAFLVAACRFLAKEVLAAWVREGKVAAIAKEREDVLTHAARMVAQSCLYGVDKNPFAVSLGKLSLWLATLAKEEPFTFVDHALRCGDSLVGLSFEQIEKFTWEPVEKSEKPQGQLQLDLFRDEIAYALKEALAARQRIETLAPERSLEALQEKERLLDDATDALARVRAIGDLIVGAFFAHDKPKDREAERVARERKVRDWLRKGGPMPEDLSALAAETRQRLVPFHWPVEFPEIFFLERRDPLEDGAQNRAADMDAFVGNPPFLGGSGISGSFGAAYLDWLLQCHPGAHGNADLVAHFFRRTNELLGRHGTIGLIATKTIAQGDTRATGLQNLLRHGLEVYDATRLMMWPGDAAVAVAVVHLAKGRVLPHAGGRRLDDIAVNAINSRLRAGAERGDPVALAANDLRSFLGSKVYGQGFVLTPEERDALVAKAPRNAERIFPYLGGAEVNTSPTQMFDRYVIHFGQVSLEEAGRWPDLLKRVHETVKPERDKLADNADGRRRKAFWWQFGRDTPALTSAIKSLQRCLVTAVVTKHLMFSFQPSDRVFSHRVFVFPFEIHARFAVMQSRVHVPWAWLLSSSMKADLNYSASDCFETFPFPEDSKLSALEQPGKEFYEARAGYMIAANQGLTATYNELKDGSVRTPEILRLRALTVAMDRAVLEAYGWGDLEPPPFEAPETPEQKRALALFEDTVIDRLFALNAERARTQGAAPRRASEADDDEAPAPKATRPKKAAKK